MGVNARVTGWPATASGAPASNEAMEKPQVVMDNKEIVSCG